MKLVALPEETDRPLSFYLAEEEWLAAHFPSGSYFFIWQVKPSVICGRNQLMAREVNLDFCREHGIRVYRRKSGGGAVYADDNNLMLSLVTDTESDVVTTFSAYTSMVARSLRMLGLDASDNSRNDVLIGDRKVSGNSYLHLPGGRCIVHGTMLWSCDPETMLGALTPSTAKLQSHGVRSVRSRVTTIREHLPGLSRDDFRRHLLSTIPDEETITLTPDDVAEIERIAEGYHRPEWLDDRNPPATLRASARFDGVGEVGVHLRLHGGRITEFDLSGDFLETADAASTIRKALRDTEFTPSAISAALDRVDIPSLIPGLDKQSLMTLIL